jgi:hypothetical protein
MWPYTNDERLWLEPSRDWAKRRIQADPLPTPANDDERAEDKRPFDPKTFIRK